MKNGNLSESTVNIITSLVNSAIMNTDGVATDEVFLKKKKKKLVYDGINFFYDGEQLTIDVYIKVVFGYNVAKVSCNLQEKIINDIADNISLSVKSVNIIVNGVLFN